MAGVSEVRRFHICSLSFSRLQQNSHCLKAKQHQDQVDLHRALTSSSQIATAAILLSFPPHEQHIQNNFDDVSPIPIKVHPLPPKTTFKHQSVNLVIELFLVIELIELQFLSVF